MLYRYVEQLRIQFLLSSEVSNICAEQHMRRNAVLEPAAKSFTKTCKKTRM